MAQTVIAPVQLNKNTTSADLPIASGAAIVAGDDHVIAYPEEGKLIIAINNTTAGAKNLTVKAGNFLAAGQGDLVTAMAQDDVRYLVLGSDRFKNTEGNIVIQVEAGTTGFIMALYLP
ncbi:MAG: hypothetical protein HYS25_13770 [Ignavibacteriales bacterium]|nr:hypothetical protein [Ignavibacteriales bacterium]